VSGLEFEPLEI